MTQGIQKVHDALCILAIRIMRGYSLYSPFEKGLCRINDVVISAARTLSNESRMVVRSRDGRKFVVNPKEKQYHMGLLGMGVFEPVETQAVVKCLSEGDVAFDVGANIGWYTTLLSQLVGPYGRVHAFEPVVDTFQALERNCKVNACTNVKLNNHALGEKDCKGTMHYFPDEACGNASMFRACTTPSIESTCDVTTLDGYIGKNQVSRCDFIKCDVEGSEMAVIKGASRTLQEFSPGILVELNPSALALAGYSPRDVLCAIRQEGPYRFFYLDKCSYQEIKDLESSNRAHGYCNVLCIADRSRMFARIAEEPDTLKC